MMGTPTSALGLGTRRGDRPTDATSEAVNSVFHRFFLRAFSSLSYQREIVVNDPLQFFIHCSVLAGPVGDPTHKNPIAHRLSGATSAESWLVRGAACT